jgi:hypothetical protein
MPKYPTQGLPSGAGHFHKKRVRVSIVLFEESHGRPPSGEGDWAFSVDDGEPIFIYGMYSEAKRQILAHARSINATEVEVLP